MARYEVSVRSWEHVTVEADSEDEAREKALDKSDLDEVYQLVNLDD